jgi:hypothetical protein
MVMWIVRAGPGGAGPGGRAVAYPILERTRGNGPAWDWYESHFGTGGADRIAIHDSIGHADPANDRYAAYRSDLPEESDAWDGDGALARRWREEAAGGAPVAVRPVLRRGDYNSAEVRYLQQLLAYRSYWAESDVDADFGERTEQVVRRFQREHGLSDDGVVGPATWEALIP